MTLQNRILYLDVVRIIATFFVVMLHVSCIFLRENTIGWYAGMAYDSLCRWCVPAFVMISGALFLPPQKEISIRLLYSKYILKLVCTFVVWFLLYEFIFDPVYPLVHNLRHGLPVSYVYDFSFVPEFHLWFLPMLIGIYMLIPVLKEIAKNTIVCSYFIILWFTFTVCNMFFHFYPLHSEPIAFFSSNLQMQMVLGYSGYFLLGYFLSVIRIDKVLFRFSLCMLIIMAISTSLLFVWVRNEIFGDYLMPNIILMSAALFIVVRYDIEKFPPKSWAWLAEETRGNLQGVYLIHVFFISIIPPFFKIRGFEAFVLIPLLSILIFVVSLYTTKLLRKIPYVRYFCS